MAKAKKKATDTKDAKKASKLFHDIMKASITVPLKKKKEKTQKKG